MLEKLLHTLCSNVDTSHESDAARRQLYLDINTAQEEENDGVAEAFDKLKSAILPVLVKDSLHGGDQVQNIAMEIIGHLGGMAESMSPFELHEVSSLWSTVARVLYDESRGRLCKIAALFAVSHQTMGPSLMKAQAPVLAPAVAGMTHHKSTVVRKEAAAALNCLLGDAPEALALCAMPMDHLNEDTERDGAAWAPCLLRLCLDDSVGVRAEALKAARRAVKCLARHEGIAGWVLHGLDDGTFYSSLDRVLYHHEAPRAEAVSGTSTLATAENPTSHTPCGARVKHAIQAWAVHMSLADPEALIETQCTHAANRFPRATKRLLELTSSFRDPRSSVRIAAWDAWEMFVSTCISKLGPDKAVKTAEAVLSPFSSRITKERDSSVREALLSALVNIVGSFPSRSLGSLWSFSLVRAHSPHSPHREGGGEEGVGKSRSKSRNLPKLLSLAIGNSIVSNARHELHSVALILARLLPCLPKGTSRERRHPNLQHSGLDSTTESRRIQSLLEALMAAFTAPDSRSAASSIGDVMAASCRMRQGSGDRPGDVGVSLELLPTSSLIVRAWCGLVVWLMSCRRRRICPQRARRTSTSVSGPKPDNVPGSKAPRVASDIDLGGTAEGMTEPEADVNDDDTPLREVLGGVLLGATLDDANEVPGTTENPPASLSSSGTGAKANGWRMALLSGLVRVFSSAEKCGTLASSPTNVEDAGDLKTDEYLLMRLSFPIRDPRPNPRERQTTSSVSSAMPARTSENVGGSSRTPCPENCRRGDGMIHVLLDEWGGDATGSAPCAPTSNPKDPADPNGSILKSQSPPQSNSQYSGRTLPLWLWLLVAVLKEPCGDSPGHPLPPATSALDSMSGGHPTSTKKRKMEPAGSFRRDDSPGCGTGSKNADTLDEDRLVCEILSSAPSGSTSKVLECFSRGAMEDPDVDDVEGAQEGCQGVKHLEPNRGHRAKQERRECSLWAFAGTWCAHVRQLLNAWHPFCEGAIPESGVTLGQGNPHSPDWHGHARDFPTQPNAGMLSETVDALRAPLKLAILLSRSRGGRERCPAASSSLDGDEREMGRVSGSNSGASVADEVLNPRDGTGVEVRVKAEVTWGNSQAVAAVFGYEASLIWRRLLSARQAYPNTGLARDVRRLAKDCATVALSRARQGSPAILSQATSSDGLTNRVQRHVHDKLDPDLAERWGLLLSQTQPSQTQAREIKSTHERPQPHGGKSREQDCPPGLELGPSPPLPSVPLLAAVAAELIHVSVSQTGATSIRAWGAALAMLAWTLSSAPSAPSDGLAPTESRATQISPSTGVCSPLSVMASATASRDTSASSSSTSSARTTGKGGDNLEECVQALSSVLASTSSARSVHPLTSSATPPWGTEFLGPLCRFLAIAVTRIHTAKPSSRGEKGGQQVEELTACLFSRPGWRVKTRELVGRVLSGVKGFPREVLASPAFLRALSPLLQAILSMPKSSDADRLQSSLLEAWNHSFGTLEGNPQWVESFPSALLKLFSSMAARAEVKMPPGLDLQDTSKVGMPQSPAELREGSSKHDADFGDGDEDAEGSCSQSLDNGRDLEGVHQVGYEINGVAGMLQCGGTRGTFIRSAQSFPACVTPLPLKRAAGSGSPNHVQDSKQGVGVKFMRVVNPPRNKVRVPRVTKRAMITTHTSLDGSQPQVHDDSQLPDSEPELDEPDMAKNEPRDHFKGEVLGRDTASGRKDTPCAASDLSRGTLQLPSSQPTASSSSSSPAVSGSSTTTHTRQSGRANDHGEELAAAQGEVQVRERDEDEECRDREDMGKTDNRSAREQCDAEASDHPLKHAERLAKSLAAARGSLSAMELDKLDEILWDSLDNVRGLKRKIP